MPEKSRPSSGPEDYEALYEHYIAALTLVGTSECGMARDEARTLAHDVLLASVPHIGRVPDLRTWLTGAMTEAARTQQRISVHGTR